MILSAVKDSYTDIFEYTVLGNSHIQLTNDKYDDLEPTYFSNAQEIIFSSNRKNITSNKIDFDNDFDLYKMDFKMKQIIPLTNSNDVNERSTH